MFWRAALSLHYLLKVELCLFLSPLTSTTMEHPFTLCNCDCKILTTAICRGLQRYTMRFIHPSERCISARQMTYNIFEIDTAALAHVACAPQESGILLTVFAAAYPSVNHAWIFHVLEKTELPEFICRFVRRILLRQHCTHVEFAGMTRGQFLMARGVRQGCLASGFLFAMAFDSIFCWLQDAIIPRNPAGRDLLQTVPCAYADDLAVAAPSFRCLRLLFLLPSKQWIKYWAQFEPTEMLFDTLRQWKMWVTVKLVIG